MVRLKGFKIAQMRTELHSARYVLVFENKKENTKMCLGFVKHLNSDHFGEEHVGHTVADSSVTFRKALNMSLGENHAENLVSVQDTK